MRLQSASVLLFVVALTACGSDTATETPNAETEPPASYSSEQTRAWELEFGACRGVLWHELREESGYRGGGDDPSPVDVERAVEMLERTQGWPSAAQYRAAVEGCIAGFSHG